MRRLFGKNLTLPTRSAALGLHGLVAFLFLATAGSDVRAQDEVWEEVAGLQVVHADAILPLARIFDSPDYLHQLIVTDEEAGGFVLDLKARSVSALPAEAIAWNEQTFPAPDLSQTEELGLFINDEGILSFESDAGSYVVRPEPPMIGVIATEKLLAAKPDYVHAASKYVPDEQVVAALSQIKTPTVIKVFFGTWCSYCKHWMPHLMKAVESAENPALTIEYVGMSEDQSEPADLLGMHDVSLTPTFIVLQDGVELGRFEEEPLVSVEADIARILGVGP